jgi:hypothetical protein
VEATITADWSTQLLVDFAPATRDGRVTMKDAWVRYSGWRERGVMLTLGNQKMPFSRSALTSTSRRALVERPITGERAFGAPGRALSAKLDGRVAGGAWQWSATVASMMHEPAADQIRLDGIADADRDSNEGVLAAGRVEWHPLGEVPRDQAAFDDTSLRFTVGVAGYLWENDGDRNLHTLDGVALFEHLVDLQHARAVEVSTGIRARRTSIDAEYHLVTGVTVDRGFSGGLFRAGHTRLHEFGVEGGYMILPQRLEALGGFDTLAATTYESLAYRPAIGVNWYFLRHTIKLQIMHRESFNARGAIDARVRSTFVQVQFGF